MMYVFLFIVLLVIALLLFLRYLRGADQRQWDSQGEAVWQQRFSTGPALNDEHRAVVDKLRASLSPALKVAMSQRLALLRRIMDEMFGPGDGQISIVPASADGVDAEWVIAPGADTSRRTLYIHGGAWTMGSARSHRVITQRFAEVSGGAVMAINYRLMPEHQRRDGIVDCQRAYAWMLQNGPQGAAAASAVFVAGDSAGGNLTLSLLAWLRDQGLRAPNAAVAICPATDGTLTSPSLRTNLATDAMLGPMFGRLLKVPHALLLCMGLLQNRMRPSHPLISPLFGELHGLPPLLIHASEAEMLLDDARRYTCKAHAAGSPVRLQTWAHVPHVWHIFHPDLTEARQAFDEIGRFLNESAPRPA